MPATSQEPAKVCFSKTDFSFRFWSTKEGVGETSGQTVGSSVSGFPAATDPAEERDELHQRSSSVRISNIRNVTGGFGRGES